MELGGGFTDKKGLHRNSEGENPCEIEGISIYLRLSLYIPKMMENPTFLSDGTQTNPGFRSPKAMAVWLCSVDSCVDIQNRGLATKEKWNYVK